MIFPLLGLGVVRLVRVVGCLSAWFFGSLFGVR